MNMRDRNRKPSWWEWNGGVVYMPTVTWMRVLMYVLYACGLCKGCE